MPAIDDPHFRQFAGALEKAIAANREGDPKDFLKVQRQQVDELVALERRFRKTLVAHRWGDGVYRAFIHFIRKVRRNILDARPYFRERQHVFTRHISRALKAGNVRRLQRFRFNYRFVQFVLNSRQWHKGSELVSLGRSIAEVRNKLVVLNMPLAISRARIFFSRTPKAHLQYMDLIQIACEGLMAGIDKFVPPFSKAFRSTAIGRMTGNFIENYSQTAIHFYPPDKRKLYRANKFAGRQPDEIDYEMLAAAVNKGLEEVGEDGKPKPINPAHRTNSTEIADLMAAASTVSADYQPAGDEEEKEERVTDRFAAPDEWRPDVIVEREELSHRLDRELAELSVFDRKVLALKGVAVDLTGHSRGVWGPMTMERSKIWLQTQPDFIASKRYNWSLAELKRRHPGEVGDRIAAAVLMLTEDELREAHEAVVKRLRGRMITSDSL